MIEQYTFATNLCYCYGNATEDQIELFSQLVLVAQTYTDSSVRQLEKIRACLRSILPLDARYTAVYVNNQIIGFTIGCNANQLFDTADIPSKTFCISDIAVHYDYRRRGIARKMIQILAMKIIPQYHYLYCHLYPESKMFYLQQKEGGWCFRGESHGKLCFLKKIVG